MADAGSNAGSLAQVGKRDDIVELQHCLMKGVAALFKLVAGMAALTMDSGGKGVLGLAPYTKAVGDVPALHVKGADGAFALFGKEEVHIGPHMIPFLLPGEHELNGPVLVTQLLQGLGYIQGDDNAALHIQHTGTVGLAVLNVEGVLLVKAALGVNGVDMSAEHHRFARAVFPQDAQQDAAPVGTGGLGPAAEPGGFHLAPEPGLGLLHIFLLVKAAFQVDELLPLFNHLVFMGINIGANPIKILVHAAAPFLH